MGCADNFNSALGIKSSTKQVNPMRYDPLGASGQGQRESIYGQFNQLRPGLVANADATAGMLRAGANDPGWAAARQLATDQINGKYLNGSPQLDQQVAQMRAGSNAEMANNNSRIRSNFARNGMNFGTANTQAEQSNQALNTANENNTEAQTRLANYTNERGIQQQSPAMLDQATSSPANYLAAIPNQYLSPLTQEAQTVAGLSGGGPVAQPDTLVRPSAGQEGASMLGSL